MDDPLRAVERIAPADAIRRIVGNLAEVVHAPPETLELTVLCLLAEGHLIIEDLPGVGKTTLAKALARSIDCSFSRLQFTPDLLPSDVTGVSVFDQRTNEFEFRPGPVFANILLVDEINRASPKTQAALLARFTGGLAIGSPPLAEEARMLTEQTVDPPLDTLEPVAAGADVVAL